MPLRGPTCKMVLARIQFRLNSKLDPSVAIGFWLGRRFSVMIPVLVTRYIDIARLHRVWRLS